MSQAPVSQEISGIPVIDFEAALSDNPPDGLLDTVRTAAEQFGVLQVVNHGVPQDVLDGFHQPIDRILGLPRTEKAALASPTAHPYRGWRQWPDDFGRLELERFSLGQFDNPQEAEAAGLSTEHAQLYTHANVWPPQEPGLREAAHRYHDTLVGLGRRVLSLYARILGVTAADFPLGGVPYTQLVVNDYPTWPHPADVPDEEKLLLLEHPDTSAVTVLHQQGDYAGLQVQRADGTWTPVPIIPGALQVLIGTLLTNWTNGKLRSGRHRVVAGGTATRRSHAVFISPSLETVVEPLAPFVGDGEPDYEPFSVGEEAGRWVENYMEEYGRPEQIKAWREGRPYVAELAETNAVE